MKALEILNNYKRFDGFIRDIISDSFLNEAIKEIEELNNRSCNSCKYYDGTQTCNKFIARSAYSCKDFCCNRYEAKGE